MGNEQSTDSIIPHDESEGSSVDGPQCSSHNVLPPEDRVTDQTSSHSVINVKNAKDGAVIGAKSVMINPSFTAIHHYTPLGYRENGESDATAIEERKLSTVLENRSREISGTLSLPIELDLAIKFERLELKHGIQRSFSELDEEGHYNKRKDFEKMVMRPLEGNVNFEQIFVQAVAEATTYAMYKTNTKRARKAFVNRHGNTVALIGQAGIGKTTLAKRMVQLILDHEVLPETQYLFYIPLREVDFKSESTIFRFMMTGCEEWEHSAASDKLWIEKLKNNPNVVFIFDGLDEANTDQLSQGNLAVSQSANMFIRKIFKGQLFPFAKKLITSRPTQFFELDADCRPHFAVEILGLNQDSQEKLGVQICQSNFTKVKDFLHIHPDVSASCFVPANCIITYGVLSMSIEEGGKITIRSLTEVFVEALAHYIRSDHLRGNAEEVWKLSSLAWNGFINHKIIFIQRDFNFVKINVKTIQSFLFTATKRNIKFSILNGDKKFSFSHLVWQELFAAINAMFVLPEEEFKHYLEDLRKPIWEVVSKFMFGLTHPAVMTKIREILPHGIVRDFDDKKKQLHNLAVNLMQRHADDVSNILSVYHVKPDLLYQVCSWVQEADDEELTEHVANHLPEKIFTLKSMLPTDVSCLIYVLQRARKAFTANFYRATFHQDSLQRLLKGFATSQVKIEMLDLSYNPIDDDAAASLAEGIGNINQLLLSNCHLSSHATIMISNKILSLTQPIEMLNLSFNPIDDIAAASLSEALLRVRRLRLWCCGLTSEATTMISHKIATLPQPMEELDLSYNHIDDDAAVALIDAMINIKELLLSECELTTRATSMISKHLPYLTHRLFDCRIGLEDICSDSEVDQ